MSKAKVKSPFRRHVSNLSIENADGDEAKIMLYDAIGFFGITSKDFIAALDGVSARKINLHINSPGGDVFEGLAIANAIRAHDSRVIVHVDALAASIASVIAIAGDYVRMADNAFLMIHDPYALSIGNAAEMRKMADLLDKVGGSIVGEYMKRTDESDKRIKEWMADETWFTAAEAKEHGFIDAIDGASTAPTDAFDLSIYNKTPQCVQDRCTVAEPTVRDTERALREAGWSRNEAYRIASSGMAALARPREEDGGSREENGDVVQMLQQLQTTLSS